MRVQPIATTPERYVAVLDAACTARYVPSCMRLADVVVSAPGLERDDARSRRAFERACALGEGLACISATDSEDGWEAKAEPLRGEAERRCDAHDARGCELLSLLALFAGDRAGKTRFDGEAERALEASCQTGTVDDCMMAVRLIETGTAPDKAARASPLLERGCALGDGEACSRRAVSAPELSDAQRAELQRRGCDRGAPKACLKLASDAMDANAPDADRVLAHALAVAEAACGLGDVEACPLVASLVAAPPVSDGDAHRLAELASRACDHHDVLACANLATALVAGPASRRDEARAAGLRDRACKLGYPFTCAPRPEATPAE